MSVGQRDGVQSDPEEYVTATEARRMTGHSWVKLQRLALIGRVGVEVMPGTPVRYRKSDLLALGRRPVPQLSGA